MIRVPLATEPPTFDNTVRRPGLSAIAEMVGEPSTVARPGPCRKKIADHRADIPPSSYPDFWTRAIDDLLTKYDRCCAFLACYIHPATGVATVDHMVPKSRSWDTVYEWSNYRLASHLMNSLKSDTTAFLDPFEIEDDWFGLEWVGFEVVLRKKLRRPRLTHAQHTLKSLNQRACCQLRKEYAQSYESREITLNYSRRTQE